MSAQTDDFGGAPPPDVDLAADAGAFLPFTMAARSDTQDVLVSALGGYDSAHDAALFESLAQATVVDRLAFFAGATYLDTAGLHPTLGLRLDVLREEESGISLAAASAYEAQGFNLTPAVIARVAISRTLGRITLAGNLAYGHGMEEDERYGDVRVAALHRVVTALSIGLDSRLRFDLERDSDEPEGEPDWELVAGPVATYTLGQFALTANAGLSALKLRFGPPARLGVAGTLGVAGIL